MTSHRLVTVESSDGYRIQSRYWACENPKALMVVVTGVVSHALWIESIANALQSARIATLAMDRRGSGANQVQRGDAPSADILLNDLATVIEHSVIPGVPTHLAGFCWGSNYILNFLQSTQHDFASIILIAPSLFPSSLIKERIMKIGDSGDATEEPVMPIDQFTDGPEYENYILPDPLRLKKVSPRLNGIMQQFSAGIWMKFLRLQLPCLTILGARDTVVDNTATEQVFNRLRVDVKQLHVLPACHGIQFDQPEQVTQHISDWINLVNRSIHE
jgi:acylglycerol lipase